MKVRFDASRGKKKPWCLDIGTFKGIRRREFFETKAAAKKAMTAKLHTQAVNGRQSVDWSNEERLEYRAAKKEADALEVSLMQCVLFCKANMKRIEPKLLSDAVEACLSAKIAAGKRVKYTNSLRASLRQFAKLTPSVEVSAVTRVHVESWARYSSIPKAVNSLATVRGRIINAQTFFNFCIKQKWCAENPAMEIEKIKIEDKPPGIHTVEQVQAVLNCALENDREILGYLVCCYFGGLRPSESMAIKSENIHKDFIEVESTSSKTRRRRFIPINPALEAWFKVEGIKFGMSKRSKKLNRLKWILGGKKCDSSKKFNDAWIITGFPWPHDVMRHSFCSYGLPKFGATKIAEWAGHSEQILFAHYRERVKPDDAERFWNLRPGDGFLSPKK